MTLTYTSYLEPALTPEERRAHLLFERELESWYQAVHDQFAVCPVTGEYLNSEIQKLWIEWYAAYLKEKNK